MTCPGTVRRLLAAAVLGLGLLAGAAPAASAHDILVATDPANGSVLEASPSQIRLTFTDPVLEGTAQVRVDGRSGVAPIAPVTVSGSTVTVPLTAALPSGGYTVLWRVTSQDGHPVSGTFSFTVATGARASGSPSAAPSPAAASPAAGASVAGASVAGASEAGTGPSATPVVTALLLTGLAAAAGAAAWWWSRRRAGHGSATR